jgi:cytochrome c556
MVLKEKATRGIFFLLTIALAVTCAGMVHAQEDEGVLSYRQKLMVSLGTSMGSIGDMLKYKLPYDSKHIATHANHISNISKLIGEAFEKEVAGESSDSKPEIWQEWDKFIAAADALTEAGAGLAKAAQGGDKGAALMPHVKAVGDACNGCHEPFRKPQ